MAAKPTPRTTPRRRRLLCIEDDARCLALVQEVVAARRHLVLATAANLDAALELARREPPEVMLVNIDLAGVAAAGIMKTLRANPATQATPILALGDDAAPEAAVKALDAGFFLYLVQPLQSGPLTEALDYALEFSARERAEL
jgi:DNA-binding response OmpR family regulator